MSNDLSSLTEEHVRQLARIIGTLEQSTFDFLQLEVGDLKVSIGKGNLPAPESSPPSIGAETTSPRTPVPVPAPTPALGSATEGGPPAPQSPVGSENGQVGAVEITSPIMGMFYVRPEPGAPAFVTIGASVAEDSTVGLVEVMKTFNAVPAGVRGKIVEICAPDAQLVEYGQILFRVLPE